MVDPTPDYSLHLARARDAMTRMQQAEETARAARAERDAEVLAMLAVPGSSLGAVAADLGVSKSLVAVIQRTARARFDNLEAAQAYIETRGAES